MEIKCFLSCRYPSLTGAPHSVHFMATLFLYTLNIFIITLPENHQNHQNYCQNDDDSNNPRYFS